MSKVLDDDELEDILAGGGKVATRAPEPDKIVQALEDTTGATKRTAVLIGAGNAIAREQNQLSERILAELEKANLRVPSEIVATVTKRDEDGLIETVAIRVVA